MYPRPGYPYRGRTAWYSGGQFNILPGLASEF
jgi:hypothetical protein